MDYVTDLPTNKGYDVIMVIVDLQSNMRHLVPYNETANAKYVARMYLDNEWKLHGLTQVIVSDRVPQFTSHLWIELCSQRKIQQ